MAKRHTMRTAEVNHFTVSIGLEINNSLLCFGNLRGNICHRIGPRRIRPKTFLLLLLRL
ncbi:hypothetical protein CBM2608_B80021 [Cupriavidus taiwanensis]|uniref:Uncharacterized protein n=1 Tax=Cupriavidus taiwanensis TaxID=164546 RepID=A0A375C7K5_9BURK|nr:hypothetical protein CBM2589_A70228 [Cupriavidus taiwanensis]SOZ31444.1 hypothetical protein CBM2608_B80021 [Cupriavidus taiwanensis]SOZ67761.1 hypothetical protein CBM2617_B110148 [Cupriavidus taiwanensis]